MDYSYYTSGIWEDKNVFSITETGKTELKHWLSDSGTGICNWLSQRNGKTPVNARFYEKEIKEPTQAIYWDMTIEYGMMYMDMLRRWSKMCIERLEAL